MANKQEKETKRSSSTILLIAFAVFVGIVMITVAFSWIFREFDAQGYVSAVLNQHYQGDMEEVSLFVEDKTREELYAQYEDGVLSFVQNNITSGVEIDAELEQKYVELAKDVFMITKYNVGEAEKISRREYRVPVEYQTMNVFLTFIELVEEESVRIHDKVEKGEYKGSLEEINAQIQDEFLNNSYTCLEEAYKEVSYETKETMIFVVKQNDEGLFVIDKNQIHDFTAKILGLDEIQD